MSPSGETPREDLEDLVQRIETGEVDPLEDLLGPNPEIMADQRGADHEKIKEIKRLRALLLDGINNS